MIWIAILKKYFNNSGFKMFQFQNDFITVPYSKYLENQETILQNDGSLLFWAKDDEGKKSARELFDFSIHNSECRSYYALMTIVGDFEKDGDFPRWKIGRQTWEMNNVFWNKWACSHLSPHEKQKVAEKLGVPVEQLSFASQQEVSAFLAYYRNRLGDTTAEFPDPRRTINLKGFYFDRPQLWFRRFIPSSLMLEHSTFGQVVHQEYTIYSHELEQNWSYYCCAVNKLACRYEGNANYGWLEVGGHMTFSNSTFSERANFSCLSSRGDTFFEGSIFERDAEFHAAKFGGEVDFSSCTFKRRSNFDHAFFCNSVPRFSGSSFDSDFVLPAEISLDDRWPAEFIPIKDKNGRPDKYNLGNKITPKERKQRYQDLRSIANGLENLDYERFFQRLELRTSAQTVRSTDGILIKAYDCFSDFGYSFLRPLIALAAMFVFWDFVFVRFLLE
jgi:hypothetical protein